MISQRPESIENVDINSAKIHPEETSFFLTRIMAFWLTPLIKLASERQLLESDVWDCPTNQSVKHDANIVRDSWLIEKQSAIAGNRQPDLARALAHGFGTSVLLAGCFQFCFLCAQLAQPFLVGELVNYIATGDGDIRDGLGYAFGLAAVSLVSSISLSGSLYSLRRLGVGIRSGVMMAVYEQALKLTSASRLQNTVGQTTNLMSIDSEKLFLATQFLHFLWHGPLTGIAVMLILIREVGYAPALAGLGFIFVLIPTQNYFAEQIGSVRRSMIRFTDERVKLTNELLQAIRVIKLYAWEMPIEHRVELERKKEVKHLTAYLLASSRLRELLFSAQPVAALIIFSISVYAMNKPLSVVQVFRVLAFLNITRYPLNLLAQALKNFNDGKVSIQRLNRFFMLPVLETTDNQRVSATPSIELNDATFSWAGEDKEITAAAIESPPDTEATHQFRLSHLTFQTKSPSELIAVIGQVGSGKSSLIAALLNEIPRSTGTCVVTGNISYCAQTPWIQNMSLRDNVLFGADASESCEVMAQYERAIEAAALRHDLQILPHGDLTEIGERGINLSGGQKARVSIARALFSAFRSQLFLFDDPFSAVDGATGNWIFEHGIVDLLKDKMRIVVLNSHMHLVKRFDRVVILDNGVIAADGAPSELLITHPELLARITGIESMSPIPTDEISIDFTAQSPKIKLPSSSKGTAMSVTTDNVDKSKTNKILVQKEQIIQTKVSSDVFIKYFAASLLPSNYFAHMPMFDEKSFVTFKSLPQRIYGSLIVFGIFLIFGLAQLSRLSVDYYLSRWAVADGRRDSSWSTVYFISLGVLGFVLIVRSLFLNYFAVLSGVSIHGALLRSVLSAPIPTFFDTHTIGEILNRFGKDTEVVDSSVPETLLQVLINWSQVLSIFALCIWASPYFTIVLFPLLFGFYHMYKYFSNISQALKKLESVSRSPIYASLSETLLGLETIRAYGDTSRFLSMHLKRMDRNQKFFFHMWMSMSWVTVRLELATSFILLAISLISVCLRDSISPISLGLALSFGLQLTALFQRCVQISIDMSNYMTSTERLFEYLDIPHENSIVKSIEDGESNNVTVTSEGNNADVEQTSSGYEMVSRHEPTNPSTATKSTAAAAAAAVSEEILSTWPTSGSISFEDVWMQYRDNPPVLKGITFSVNKGERIGVCGRTGAGKSSVMTVFFRIVELTKGRILVDGVDISQIPLQILRSKLAIIPQDPVLFTGSIRYQLDPFAQHSDEEVWEALGQVNMSDTVRTFSNGIHEEVKENGENLSQGQRQLLCIARALLRQTRILIVDEGTSAVDPYTDELIQKVLRDAATKKGTTVLAIAHRLQTIVDFDRILVLGYGKIVEFDTPQSLLANPESVFSAMISEAHQ